MSQSGGGYDNTAHSLSTSLPSQILSTKLLGKDSETDERIDIEDDEMNGFGMSDVGITDERETSLGQTTPESGIFHHIDNNTSSSTNAFRLNHRSFGQMNQVYNNSQDNINPSNSPGLSSNNSETENDSSPFAGLGIPWRSHAKLIGMLFLLVVSGTAETISYTLNGKVHMSPYRCFLNELVILTCIVFFFVLQRFPGGQATSGEVQQDDQEQSFLQQQQQDMGDSGALDAFEYSQSFGYSYSDNDSEGLGNRTPSNYSAASYRRFDTREKDSYVTIRRKLFGYMFVMAFCDSLALYINLLASKDVGGALRIIMQQLTIPASMLFSSVLLGRKFSTRHFFGATLVVFGILLCLVNVLKGSPGQTSSASWSIVFACSCVPLTVAGCLKEWVLINPKFECDANFLNQWVAIFQFFIGLLALPIGIYVQNLDTEDDGIHIGSDEIMDNFWAGFKCGCLGINSYDDDHMPKYGKTDCSSAALSTWVYMATVCLFNLLMLLVIREGTAVLFFVANGVIIPIVAIISASPIYEKLGLERESVTIWQFLGLIVTVVGCIDFGMAMMNPNRYSKGDGDEDEDLIVTPLLGELTDSFQQEGTDDDDDHED